MKKVLINISVITATILSSIATSLPVIATDINKLQVNRRININTIKNQQTNPWKQRSFKIAKCNGYETNKFDKKAKVEGGGWKVSWAKDISETDVLLGFVTAGVSVYDGSTTFQVWAQNLVRRTISSLGEDVPKNVKGELTTILKKVVFDAVTGRSAKNTFKQFNTFDFKAGAIKYSGRNRAFCNTISRTWGLKPYVAFKIRSSIKKPSNPELPIKNAYFIHNNTVFYSSTGNSHCAFLKPEPHAEHLRRNKNYIELGIQNPSKFGTFTGKCKELPIKNAYFIHNNIVFYTSTGTSHCAFLKPEPYAEHLRKNKNYLELGIQNPLKFGNFTGKCPKI